MSEIVERIFPAAVNLRSFARMEREIGHDEAATAIETAVDLYESAASDLESASKSLRVHSSVVIDQHAEITRLRTLLEDLVRAVEPFATDAMFLNGIAGTCPLRVPEYVDVEDHELGSTISDLRRAREAYLKAKGV